MIVVSDTSPITNLDAVGHLDLLRQLYGKVMIPQAVYQELTAEALNPAAVALPAIVWIETRPVLNRSLVTALTTELDEGEAEAIALALEVNADLVLMDERLGRTVAARFSLHRIGLLGVLIEAKRHGCIPAVKPVLEALIAKADFWVSQHLYAQVVRAAGE
ncbi:MAG: DUF3368 domain-containing protein [Acidobacteria bacterium]|nr:DUF3368 domain-containing protein [Acidobacteriota bacterium]MCI0724834.1 DUF3368 domain-containing protein [Acidobacteriota bacterium]